MTGGAVKLLNGKIIVAVLEVGSILAIVLWAIVSSSQTSPSASVSAAPLTAEQVFAANFKNGTFVSGGMPSVIGGPRGCLGSEMR